MALIHVYNGLNKETEKYTFTGKLRDKLALDWDNVLLLKGGEAVSPDYDVQPDDVIFIRKLPTAASTAVVVGVVAVSTVVAGGAIGYGIYTHNQTQKALSAAQSSAAAAKEEANAAQESAKKTVKASAERVNRLPYVKGARNAAATGQTIPYIIGETYYTPMRLTPPHITIAGTNGKEQFYNFILECGYNDILIKKVMLGSTVIKSFSDTAPQNGVYSWDSGTYYDSRNIIEIRQSDEFTTAGYNEKIVLTELNKEIPHEYGDSDKWQAGVVQQLASNAKSVEVIALFDGLRKYEDGWQQQTITLQPQWSNNPEAPNPDWHNFDAGFNQNGTYSNTFTYNSRDQMRFTAKQDFTAAQSYGKKISVRIIRTTAQAESNANDVVYLMAVQTHCYDAKKSTSSNLVAAKVLEDNERAKCCRMGVRIAANDNTSGLLDAVSIIAAGVAQTWNGSRWSTNKTTTRNLAAWAREIMLSEKHAPSKYSDSELDAESWGDWYSYCQQQGFNADGVITRAIKKEETLSTLCDNSNAALFLDPMTGKIEVAIDNGRAYSVALLNSDTIQSISTQREYKRKTTGKKVTYVNRAAEYDVDNVIFMRDGGSYEPETDTLTTTALEYVTDYAHAYKIAWRQMAEEAAQPRTVTVKVGPEAAYYPLFSRVELQHRTLKNGITHAQIKALNWYGGKLQSIQLMAPVTFPAEACGILVSCVSDTVRGLLPVKVNGTGTTDTLQVLDTIKSTDDVKPYAGNFCSFGKLDSDGNFTTVTASMKIINAEDTESGYTLTLVDYNPALYEYGTLPEYRSNINTVTAAQPAVSIKDQREYVTATEVEALNTDAAVNASQAAVDTIANGYTFKNAYTLRPAGETLEEIIAKLDDDARNINASISMSEEEILLQVNDVERELRGALSVQAGAVTALVEGGGTSGQLALSLQLPVMVDEATKWKLAEAASLPAFNEVYAKVAGTDYYGIKGSAGSGQIKTLWNAAVEAGLLASQIELQADQIYIGGDVILNDEKKIKASLIEVENLLTKQITMKDKGSIKSDEYSGKIDANGKITYHGVSGWAITSRGNADFCDMYTRNATIIKGNISETVYKLNARYIWRMGSGEDNTTYLDGIRTRIYEYTGNIDKYVMMPIKITFNATYNDTNLTRFIETPPIIMYSLYCRDTYLHITTDYMIAYDALSTDRKAVLAKIEITYNKSNQSWSIVYTELNGGPTITFPDDYSSGKFKNYSLDFYLNV